MIETFEKNSCILLIDIQEDYKNKIKNYDKFKTNIKKILKKGREKNVMICFINQIDNNKSKWIPFYEELKKENRNLNKGIYLNFAQPNNKENKIIKNTNDAFLNTKLNIFLKKNKIKNLYICGLLTGVCVLNTIFTGFNLGYRIYLIKNGCEDEDKKRHDFIIKYYSNKLFLPFLI